MTIPIVEFWKTLESVGICDSKTVKDLSSALQASNAIRDTSDSIPLAKYLIKRGILTQHQAKVILASRGAELRRGTYLILDDHADSPFTSWSWAKNLATKQIGLIREIQDDSAATFVQKKKQFDQLGNKHSLLHYQFEGVAGSGVVFCALSKGKSLTQWLSQNRRFKSDQIYQVGVSMGNALNALAEIGLGPNHLETDLLWMTETGEITLLFEPSLNADLPLLNVSESSRQYSDLVSKPAGQTCTVSSAIFSLGCILFRMKSGRDPYPLTNDSGSSSTVEDKIVPPSEIVEAVRRQAAGSPTYRVLAHAIAPNPNARFKSFDDFLSAWSVAAKVSVQTDSSEGKTLPRFDEVEKKSARTDAVEDSKVPQDSVPHSRKQTEVVPSKTSQGRVAAAESGNARKGMEKSKPTSAKQHSRSNKERQRVERVARQAKPVEAAVEEPKRDPSKTQRESTLEAGREEKRNDSAGESSPNHGGKSLESSAVKKTTVGKKSSAENQVADDREKSQSENGSAESTNKAPDAVNTPGNFPEIATGEPRKGKVGREALQFEKSNPKIESSRVESASSQRSTLRRKKKKSNAPLILGGMCVAVLMLLIGLIVGGSGGDETESEPVARRPLPTVIPPVTSKKAAEADMATSQKKEVGLVGYEVVDDDDQLLFLPPYGTDTDAIPLSLLPPGPTVILSCRLNNFVGHPIGSQLLNGVSTGVESLIDTAIARSKFPVDSLKRITVATFPGTDGWPQVALVIYLNEPIQESELIEKLSVDQARTRENKTIYVGEQDDADAFYWNKDEEGDVVTSFAIGSVPQISEVANLEGNEIPLPRTSQSLWSSTSVESDLAVLYTPNFLFADGREMLNVSAPQLVGPLKRFLQPDVNAGIISVRFNEDQTVYLETRFTPSGGMSEASLMRKVRDSTDALPDWANEFILKSVQDSSWKLLAIRMPQMMQYLASNMRVGLSENSVVANAYLPDAAFPQLVFAGLLAMNTSTSANEAVVTSPSETLSIEEMLDRNMTVSFDQESLEFALEAISTAFQDDLPSGNQLPKTVIVGSDLELMGITQNQQVRDFSKTQQPLRAVLTDLVLQANPDKTATGPQDLKQSLIWVIVDSGGEKEIRITTRQAAEREQYSLPSEFQPTE